MIEVYQFLSGAAAMGFWVCGMFFHRFYCRMAEPLFLCFAIAFWLFGLERVFLLLISSENEVKPLLYTTRLIGFGFIIIAIVYQTRKHNSASK